MMLAEVLPLGEATYPCKTDEGICSHDSGEG
jgi:hypothetical protein